MNQPSDPSAPREIIESAECTLVLDQMLPSTLPAPLDALLLTLDYGGIVRPATIGLASYAGNGVPASDDRATRLFILIAGAALERMGGRMPGADEVFHLPSELRAIAIALRDCTMSGETRTLYRGAKGLELLCEAIQAIAADALVPVARVGAMSLADSSRVIAARRMIDERAHEKLTLDVIARSCGLNRAKLTRGFREMFDCSVAEAIAERRLAQASRRLLTTDLPVSSIGYESGYLNNASFARAFGRRFGRSPSDYRACRIAA